MDSRRLVPLLAGGVLAVFAAALLAIDAGGASIEAWVVLFGYGLLALVFAQLPTRDATESDRSSASSSGVGEADVETSITEQVVTAERDQLPDPHDGGFDAPLT